MRLLKPLFFFFLFSVPFYSMAWGVLGHRVTGEIAEKYLTKKARKKIAGLLGNESVAMSSNYGDFIKSDTSFNYIAPWHYIDLPAGLGRDEFNNYLRNDSAADIYTRVNFIVSQLKSGSLPREQQVFYLKLLIHFIGDAHQPMHVSHREDKGGNDIKLYWFNASTNLHRLWDENLVEFQQLSYTEMAAAVNHATKAEIKQWQNQPFSEWLFESYTLAEQIYKEVKPNDRLGYTYNFYHVAILNQQLLKGGIRLAGLLNEIYG